MNQASLGIKKKDGQMFSVLNIFLLGRKMLSRGKIATWQKKKKKNGANFLSNCQPIENCRWYS